MVVVGAAYWIYQERQQVGQALTRIAPGSLVVAFIATLLGLWASLLAWRRLLRGLGSLLSFRQGARIYFVGQLGKYIPGGVWTVMAHATLGRDLAVPKLRTATASLLAILLQAVTAAVIGAVLVLSSGPGAIAAYGWMAMLVVPLVVVVHPSVLARVALWSGRALKRPASLERMPATVVWGAAGWLGLSHVVNGAAVLALASSIATTGPPVLLVVGVTSLATALGLVVVFAPAGAGVREVVIVLGLGQHLDTGAALLVVILARLISIVADFLLAGILGRVGRRA